MGSLQKLVQCFRRGASIASDGIFTGTGVRLMLLARDYRALQKLFPVVAAFNDRSTEQEKIAPITLADTHYNEFIADATGKIVQRA